MEFEVYCDEANPDLFTSAKPKAQYMMIGSLWIPAEHRDDIKAKIKALREKHNAWGEIKWTKISPSKLDFYLDLVDLFVGYGNMMRFRCIAVDQQSVNMKLHGGDEELGFYKFYSEIPNVRSCFAAWQHAWRAVPSPCGGDQMKLQKKG